MKRYAFTHDQLLSEVLYDGETGLFTALKARTSRKSGSNVGSISPSGYVVARLFNVQYEMHRVAWFYIHATWPTHSIDHINGSKSDNRLANLRCADDALNNQNQRKANRDSKSGYLGVTAKRHKWQAKITVNNKAIHIGTYSSPIEAHTAYVTAKRKLHPGCTI